MIYRCFCEMLEKMQYLVKSGVDRLNCWGSRGSILDTQDDSQKSQVSDQKEQVETVDVDGVIQTDSPVEPQPELTPHERKRIKDREYEKAYRLRKKKQREEAKAKRIILDFKRRRETLTAEELNTWFLSVGTYIADTLLGIIGQAQFDEFTAQFEGVSRLELIPAMIELLVEHITSQRSD
jgi:hypothetical protein